jgi:hypothetical protein
LANLSAASSTHDEASSERSGLLVGRHGHVCLPRHGGSLAVAALRLPPGLALVGGVEVHLLVAALLAAEGRVALVHEDVAVAGQRLGAERAGVQLVAAQIAQRLGVEEEGACDGRGHFSFYTAVVGRRSCEFASLLERREGDERELGFQRGGRDGYLCLRAEEDDKVAHTDVDPGRMEKTVEPTSERETFQRPRGPPPTRY